MDEKEKMLLADALATAILQARQIKRMERTITILGIACAVFAVGCAALILV